MVGLSLAYPTVAAPGSAPEPAPEIKRTTNNPAPVLSKTPARGIIEFYGSASQRTLIYDKEVPLNALVAIDTSGDSDNTSRLASIRTQLETEGILLQEVGEHFVIVAHPDKLKRLPQLPGLTRKREPDEPVTILNLENMPLKSVVDLYGDLTKQKFTGGERLQASFFTLKTGRAGLTTREAAAAIEALLLLNNLKIVPQENDRFLVTPVEAVKAP